MIEKLAGAAAEIGKTAAEGLEKTFDPDKRLDPQNGTEKTDAQSKNIDLDKRLDASDTKYDDNGKAYRDGDDLRPNIQYELNGFKFETDSKGRPASAEGQLHLKETSGYDRIKPGVTKEKISKGDALETDERGHIIGNQFNGPGDIGNLTAQDAGLNKGAVKNLENYLAGEVRDGKQVYLRVDVIYSKNSFRPSKYVYNYSIDGATGTRMFKNKAA